MDINQLKKKLNDNAVPNSYYSINSDLIPNKYILNFIHGQWEYFYYDERGNQNDYRKFNIENDACDFLFKKLINEIRLSNSVHKNI